MAENKKGRRMLDLKFIRLRPSTVEQWYGLRRIALQNLEEVGHPLYICDHLRYIPVCPAGRCENLRSECDIFRND